MDNAGRARQRVLALFLPIAAVLYISAEALSPKGTDQVATDTATALKLHDKLMPLHTNLFIETNPSPVRYALSLLGKMEETLRLPMVPVSEPTRIAVRSAMVHAGLIN